MNDPSERIERKSKMLRSKRNNADVSGKTIAEVVRFEECIHCGKSKRRIAITCEHCGKPQTFRQPYQGML